jgi:hypothetical protein
MAGFDITNLNVSGSTYLNGLSNLSNYQRSPSLSTPSSSGMDLMSGIMKAISGYSLLNEGANMAEEGAKYTAGVYRQAGEVSWMGAKFQAKVYRNAGLAAKAEANYQIAIDQQQTARQKASIAQQISDMLSSNSAIIGSSIGFGSKSAMMIQNEVYSAGERNVARATIDSLQRQEYIKYQGALTAMSYENQARAAEISGAAAKLEAENNARNAEYQGEVSAYQMRSQAADQISGSFMNIFSQLG